VLGWGNIHTQILFTAIVVIAGMLGDGCKGENLVLKVLSWRKSHSCRTQEGIIDTSFDEAAILVLESSLGSENYF